MSHEKAAQIVEYIQPVIPTLNEMKKCSRMQAFGENSEGAVRVTQVVA